MTGRTPTFHMICGLPARERARLPKKLKPRRARCGLNVALGELKRRIIQRNQDMADEALFVDPEWPPGSAPRSPLFGFGVDYRDNANRVRPNAPLESASSTPGYTRHCNRDSAAYVFGDGRQSPNINHGAGIDVSPVNIDTRSHSRSGSYRKAIESRFHELMLITARLRSTSSCSEKTRTASA